MVVPLNIVDLNNLAAVYEKQEKDLERQLIKIRFKKSQLKRKLRENDGTDQKWVVEIPDECLPDRKEKVGKPLNWKKMVWTMFEKYPIPMTSEMIGYKLLLHYEDAPFDRKVLIRNVSAALHYLERKDGKLYRIKFSKKKDYVYGLKEFFTMELQTLNLQLKPGPLRDYLLEEGSVDLDNLAKSQPQHKETALMGNI